MIFFLISLAGARLARRVLSAAALSCHNPGTMAIDWNGELAFFQVGPAGHDAAGGSGE